MNAGKDELRPTRLEIASGHVVGEVPGRPTLPDVGDLEPLTALEDAIRPALERAPCVVGFSGGRDSSTLLAVATQLARRERLDLPVPVTLRFHQAPDAQESEWQELVVRHLAIGDWVRSEVADELDLLGPLGRTTLCRHGPLWPPNMHSIALILKAAQARTLITGIDGDGLLGHRRWAAAAAALQRPWRPAARDVARVALAVAPVSLQRRRELAGEPGRLPWLRPSTEAAIIRAAATDEVSEPLRWRRRVAWWARRRYVALFAGGAHTIGRAVGVEVVNPLLDDRFLAAVSRAGGRLGYTSRTHAMRALFSPVLPDSSLARSSKALFTDAFWGPATRRVAGELNDAAFPRDLVDPSGVRRECGRAAPDANVALLLQTAWLGSRLGTFEDAVTYRGDAPPSPRQTALSKPAR